MAPRITQKKEKQVNFSHEKLKTKTVQENLKTIKIYRKNLTRIERFLIKGRQHSVVRFYFERNRTDLKWIIRLSV